MTTKTKPKRPVRAGDRTASGKAVVGWRIYWEGAVTPSGPWLGRGYAVELCAQFRETMGRKSVRLVRVVRPNWKARALAAEAEVERLKAATPAHAPAGVRCWAVVSPGGSVRKITFEHEAADIYRGTFDEIGTSPHRVIEMAPAAELEEGRGILTRAVAWWRAWNGDSPRGEKVEPMSRVLRDAEAWLARKGG